MLPIIYQARLVILSLEFGGVRGWGSESDSRVVIKDERRHRRAEVDISDCDGAIHGYACPLNRKELNSDVLRYVFQKGSPLKENCAIAPFDLVPCSDVLYSWETPAKDQSPVKTILGSRSSTIA